jgi:RNA polymerase sigma-70 factor (ECF subfamily)
MSPDNLNLLIDAARKGDTASADRLLGLYRNYLCLLARTGIDASLRGKADPSDVVQEALFKASQHFGQFQGTNQTELAAWLRQILARCLTDLVRRYRGRSRTVGRERSLEQILDRSSQVLAGLRATDDSPSTVAQQRDLAVVLSDVLAELTPDYREVIVLHDLQELDWDEVASRLGRSPGAARMLWTRALQQLRPLIEARLGPRTEERA